MKKKYKKKIYIVWIVLIILVVGLIFYFNQDKFEVSFLPLSVVGGISGVSELDLTVTVENTGNVALTCIPLSATPVIFDSALAKTAKVVPITGTKKVSWTSNKISVSQFEGLPSPDRFEVIIRCSYNTGQEIVYLPDKISYIDLNILSENTKVTFRTSNLEYGTGTEIAYNSGTCGNNLTRYLRYCSTFTSATSNKCANYLSGGYFTIPCSKSDTLVNSPVCYWGSRSGIYYFCRDSGVSGTYYYCRYNLGGSTVSISPSLINNNMEVSCV